MYTFKYLPEVLKPTLIIYNLNIPLFKLFKAKIDKNQFLLIGLVLLLYIF